MNIPIGFSKFIPQDYFFHGGFIKDNCIFVRMEVTSQLQYSTITNDACSDLYGNLCTYC